MSLAFAASSVLRPAGDPKAASRVGCGSMYVCVCACMGSCCWDWDVRRLYERSGRGDEGRGGWTYCYRRPCDHVVYRE